MEPTTGIDPSILMWCIGGVFAVAIQTWMIIQFLMDRMDKKVEDERMERLTNEKKFEEEIKNIRETYVRRDDFNRHLDNVEKMFTTMTQNLSNFSLSVTGRLDSIMTMMAHKSTDNTLKS